MESNLETSIEGIGKKVDAMVYRAACAYANRVESERKIVALPADASNVTRTCYKTKIIRCNATYEAMLDCIAQFVMDSHEDVEREVVRKACETFDL